MPRRGNKGRDHHGSTEETATLHVVVGKHGDDYKDLFRTSLASDINFTNFSVPDIITSLKAFARTKNISTDSFACDMSVRSIGCLLLTASLAESSRVTKLERNRWSISRLALVAPVISGRSTITSKRHMNELRRRSDEFEEFKKMVAL